MRPALLGFKQALTWRRLAPSLRAGVGVVLLFAAGVWLTQRYAVPIREAVSAHATLGIVVFFATSVVAVLAPMLSNLPLIPVAVLAWGPGWTALLLWLGWIVGAMLSFTLGRHAQASILRLFPGVQRHADIDRLIHPQHRMMSLVMLRMTFPVDVLSYALGLFSRHTRLRDNALSTALGAAPFALLFSWFPTLSGTAQWTVFAASLAVFVAYMAWVLQRSGGADDLP